MLGFRPGGCQHDSNRIVDISLPVARAPQTLHCPHSRCKGQQDSVGLNIRSSSLSRRLFDHLIGAREQRFWHGEIKRSGGLQIDSQRDFR